MLEIDKSIVLNDLKHLDVDKTQKYDQAFYPDRSLYQVTLVFNFSDCDIVKFPKKIYILDDRMLVDYYLSDIEDTDDAYEYLITYTESGAGLSSDKAVSKYHALKMMNNSNDSSGWSKEEIDKFIQSIR